MPFAGFKNFDACVQAQMKMGKDSDSAAKICGYLQAVAEGDRKPTKPKKKKTIKK